MQTLFWVGCGKWGGGECDKVGVAAEEMAWGSVCPSRGTANEEGHGRISCRVYGQLQACGHLSHRGHLWRSWGA